MSSFPMYTIPFESITGEDSKAAPACRDQLIEPELESTLYSLLSVPPKYRTPLGDRAAEVNEMAEILTFHKMVPLVTVTAYRPLPLALTNTLPLLFTMGDV